MSEARFFRKRFSFEAEYGQHRNWWVRDQRIAGNPLSIYLYLLSHEPEHMPTQTEARKAIGLGERAWNAAKERLLRAGFMLEVRDRFPAGYTDSTGQPRGGQKRFRLELLDPEPGVEYELHDVMIDLDYPLEDHSKTPDRNQSAKCRVDQVSQSAKCRVDEKPLVGASLQNAESGSATLHFAGSFIGREKERKDWIINPSDPPVQSTVAHENETETEPLDPAKLDVELARLDSRLSVANLERELAGRVDIASIDLVEACRVILPAHRQREGLRWPPAYVAKSIVANPDRWRRSQTPYPRATAGQGLLDEDRERSGVLNAVKALAFAGREACTRGEHDWGPPTWPIFDRAHCIRDHCLQARRTVDPDFAALEAAEFEGGL